MRRRTIVPAIALVLCVAVPGASPRPAMAQIMVRCPAVSPSDPSLGVLIGNTQGGHFYASVPASVSIDTETKVVVRATGSGPLRISAIGPDQMTVSPGYLDPHTDGSSWNGILPGDEWGTAWTLPMPGCWDLHAERTGLTGDIYFNAVVPTLKSVRVRMRSGQGTGLTFRSGTRLVFFVRPQFDPSTALRPSGTVSINDGSKTVRTMPLAASRTRLGTYYASTSLTVTAATWFTGTAHLSFHGSTMTRDIRFEVVPEAAHHT